MRRIAETAGILSLCGVMAVAVHVQAAEVSRPTVAELNVGRFFEAVRADDAKAYRALAPKMVLMVTPDFGMPIGLAEARATFVNCQPREIARPTTVTEVHGAVLVAVSLSCSDAPDGPVKVDFLVRRGRLLAAYLGGLRPARS